MFFPDYLPSLTGRGATEAFKEMREAAEELVEYIERYVCDGKARLEGSGGYLCVECGFYQPYYVDKTWRNHSKAY